MGSAAQQPAMTSDTESTTMQVDSVLYLEVLEDVEVTTNIDLGCCNMIVGVHPTMGRLTMVMTVEEKAAITFESRKMFAKIAALVERLPEREIESAPA